MNANGANGKKVDVKDRNEALEWLKTLFTNLVNLEIKTAITTDKVHGMQTISTRIDLVQGDMVTTIHKDLAEGLNVYEFHQAQVLKAEAIIEKNVQTVKALAEGLLELFD